MTRVRRLLEADAEAYMNLRRESLLDSPLAFASSPDDDIAASIESVREMLRRGPQTVLFGAFSGELVGVVGLYRDRHVKSSHKVHLWGMYVVPDRRRQGIAGELLVAAIRHAAESPGVSRIELGVSSAAPAARRLYERAGFAIWGTEPDALRHEGHSVIEHHMSLDLASIRS